MQSKRFGAGLQRNDSSLLESTILASAAALNSYLAPVSDVHDELDLVTIPSVGKAAPAPRKSAARPIPFGREDDRMPAPKGRYPPAG